MESFYRIHCTLNLMLLIFLVLLLQPQPSTKWIPTLLLQFSKIPRISPEFFFSEKILLNFNIMKKISFFHTLLIQRRCKLPHRSKDAKVYGAFDGQDFRFTGNRCSSIALDSRVIAGYILFQNLSSTNSHFVRSFSPYNCAYSPVARQPSCRVGSTGIQGPPSLSSGPGSRRIRFASWTCINRSQRVLLRCPGIPASRICYYLFFFELLLYFFYRKLGKDARLVID